MNCIVVYSLSLFDSHFSQRQKPYGERWIAFDAKTGIPDAIMWLTFYERVKTENKWILFAIVCFADQNFANQREAEIKNRKIKKGFFLCVTSARYLTFTCRRFTRNYIKYEKQKLIVKRTAQKRMPSKGKKIIFFSCKWDSRVPTTRTIGTLGKTTSPLCRPYRLYACNDFVTLASQWSGERYHAAAVSSSTPYPIACLLARVTEKYFTRTPGHCSGDCRRMNSFFFLLAFLLSLLLLVLA